MKSVIATFFYVFSNSSTLMEELSNNNKSLILKVHSINYFLSKYQASWNLVTQEYKDSFKKFYIL